MEFDEDWWWNDAYNEVRFRAHDHERTVQIRITQEALTDYFQTADSSEGAREPFVDNRDLIEDVALLLLADNDELKEILITFQLFSHYAGSKG